MKLFIYVLSLSIWISYARGNGNSGSFADMKFVNESFSKLYEIGREAYLDNDWDKCARLLERSLEIYRRVQQIQVYCRKKCRSKTVDLAEVYDLEDKFFSNIIAKALCLLKCKSEFQERYIDVASDTVLKKFHEMELYNYLHNCYYQKGDVENAASAALTYLQANPDDRMIRTTLEFYLGDPYLKDASRVKSFAEKDHEDLFLRGVDAYEKKRDDQAITYMELALKYFLEEEDECRILCEGAFDQGWFPDFISSVANHYTYSLKCKQKCPIKLSYIKGDKKEHFLPNIYNYLQFSYYKAGNIEKACEAVETFLAFLPNDVDMLNNRRFYRDQPGVRKDWFNPRQEALDYIKRDQAEEALLSYIEREFK
ncbi:cartilage-associated protein-like [Artemia franciscana]|uniref:Leprecan-like alpha-helical domain-containing protein n=1 Tax=Artemia franciscana TaxID=6661 RepID=A0AA88KX07_ARTSF|nr:hypothetical protein QYM36_011961 [Artemia franciscana]